MFLVYIYFFVYNQIIFMIHENVWSIWQETRHLVSEKYEWIFYIFPFGSLCDWPKSEYDYNDVIIMIYISLP